MDKYKKADRRLAELLKVANVHWTHNSAAAHDMQLEHDISLEFDQGCCCAHTGGPTMNWIWYHDHATKGLAVRYSLVLAALFKLQHAGQGDQ